MTPEQFEQAKREFIRNWRGDLFYTEQDGYMLSDLTALIESLLPSEEDVRMEFPMGGTMKAAYNRDYAEMIKDNQSRRLGAFWLRSRLLAAIDAKGLNNIKLKQ